MTIGRGGGGRWSARAGHELVSAALFLPVLVATGFGVLALPWWARWVGRSAWRRARVAGARLSDDPPTTGARPIVVLGVVLGAHLAAFVLVVALGGLALGLVSAPVVLTLDGEGSAYDLLGWQPGAAEAWILALCGLAAAAALGGSLVKLADLRFEVFAELAEQEDVQLLARVDHLARSRASLVDAFETERRRIERDLHDGPQQRIAGLAMGVGLAVRRASRLSEDDPRAAELVAQLEAVQDEVDSALAELRDTVRGIHPLVLSDRGLFAAVRDLADRAGMDVEVTTHGDDSLVQSPVAAGCYFVVAEALTNVAKHSGTVRVTVEIRVTGDRLRARVQDAGRGGATAERDGSTGLSGLAERIETLGGTLTLTSPVGEGTSIGVDLPLVPAWSHDGRQVV